jgi:hypothetical protein
VDNWGNIFTYNGTSWSSPVADDTQYGLSSVSCPTASFCTAVDQSGNVLTYNGTSWSSPVSIDPSNGGLVSVSCFNVSFCVAVDSDGDFLTYSGTSWSSPASVDAENNSLMSVSCATASFCAAVDDSGNVLTYNGTSWSSPESIDPSAGNSLWSVSCPTASFCAAVDRFGGALTYNGTSWSSPDQIDPGHWLNSVSCATASFCAAVDYSGNVLTYNGTSWSSPVSIDAGHLLDSVSCATASFCVAVDNSGNIFTYNGSSWSSPVADDTQYGLSSVSCASASFCAAVSGSFIFVYNGSSWSSPESIDAGNYLSSISCATASFCAAVDWSGNVFTYNGTSWSSPVSLDTGSVQLYSVSCPTASFCAAVDNAGNIFTYNGSSWSSPDRNPGGGSLLSVSCSAVGFCAAVVSAYVFTYQAVATLTQTSPTSASVADGAGYSGQLTVTNAVGTLTYTETSSTDSTDVVVGSTGAITAATSLAPGTYTVSGTDHDTNGDTGTWGFALTVNPVVVTPPPSSGPPSPPSPPPGATSSQDCSSSSSSSTCSATNDDTTASGSGEGAVTVSQYASDPVGSPSFSTPGEYFDVQVASGSSFASLTITDCNLNGATSLEWWNPQADAGAGAWEPVSPTPTYTSGPPACVAATISSTSSPSLSQLTGTVFGVAVLATVPGAPTKVSAKAGNASATLTWTAPSSDGGTAITGYVIKASHGPVVKVGDVTSDTVTGLNNGTTYSFTISAVNSAGTGPSSAVSNSVTPVKATSETSLKLSSKKVTYGDEKTEHLTVSVTAGHSGTTATGTVTIKATVTTLCVIKLSSGKGSCTLSAKRLKAGTYRLVATYSGNKNFKGSTSVKVTLTVAK